MTHVATSPTAALRALDLTPGTVALWWLGQAGFAVRAGGLVLLIDPFLAPMAERVSPPAFDPADAADVDVVMCSHEHYDHLDLASLPAIARASPKARFVVPRPLVDAVAAAGIPRARILGAQPEERIRLDGVTVYPLPARHGVGMADAYTFGRELSGGLYRYLGYVVDDGVARVYHAGDTVAYDGQVERLRALRVDVALLPIN
ncbi:MAG TPA: MBL fold metallo-hydrolase, partial [Candidatus Limnocylindria bacterium]|nr:MBL fold metallo-hydrolase [Candidatus Limnocylindria bacterium]